MLAVLARYEERLDYGASRTSASRSVHTLLMEAQPNDVFVTQQHPGSGLLRQC